MTQNLLNAHGLKAHSDNVKERIISFCLYGKNPLYIKGAFINLEYAKIIYPEWKCRFYCDTSTIPLKIINKLKKNGAQVVLMKNRNAGHTAMFWRLYPFFDKKCEYFISRDLDSRLNYREKAAVDEWINSGKDLHLMHDHPKHTAIVMAGMFGCKGNSLPNFMNILKRYKQKNDIKKWGHIQKFLRPTFLRFTPLKI